MKNNDFKRFSQFFRESTCTKRMIVGVIPSSSLLPVPGHKDLLENVEALTSFSKNYRIYILESKGSPLDHNERVKWMRKLNPKHARHIMSEKFSDSPSVADYLSGKGINATLVISDKKSFPSLIESVKTIECKYNESDFIDALKKGDMRHFKEFSEVPFKTALEYCNFLREKMDISVTLDADFGEKSTVREQYVRGEIFNVGDSVVLNATAQPSTVMYRGANYLIVQENDGTKKRVWIEEVTPLREEEELEKDEDDPCQDGWVMRGTKEKNGRTVPDCVPQFPEEYARDPAAYRRKYSG